jgi:hypothetical protein
MRQRNFALLVALMGLLLASLACSTVTGGANDNSGLPRPRATATRSSANDNEPLANDNEALDNENEALDNSNEPLENDNGSSESNENSGLGPVGNSNDSNENTATENEAGNANDNAANENAAGGANENDANDNNDNGGPAAGFDQVPDDIPIVNDGEVDNLLAVEGFVSYETDLAFDSVVAFYDEEMPNFDWEYDASQSVDLGADMQMMSFHKDGQLATVVVSENPDNGNTIVLITVTNE